MKKYLLSLFAVVLAIGLSSYSPKTDLEWFNYDGDLYGGGTSNTLNYSLVAFSVCQLNNTNLCEIHAERQLGISPAKPNFSTEVIGDRKFKQ